MVPSSVSLIIPAYNCGEIIADTIIKANGYLERFDVAELIVVNDGSDDDTLERITSVSKFTPHLKLINHSRNLGKGAAVRSGVLSAQGDLILFIDADLSTPISQLDRIIEVLRRGYDVAVGSRSGGKVKYRTFKRFVLHHLFSLLTRSLFGWRIRDTQCGCKGFRRDIAKRLFSNLNVSGFCFDVQIVKMALRMGYKVAEVPIRWEEKGETSMRLIRDGMRMLIDLLRIRLDD